MALFADYLESQLGGTPQSQPSTQPLSNQDIALGKQLLPYINAYEGNPKANQTVGYQEFNDLSDHPRISVPFNKKGDKSDAAGLYQILSNTWDKQAKKLGLTDFSPENQDLAAIGIMKDIGALDEYKAGNHAKTKQLLGTQWASIPGSTIGETTGQKPKFNPQAEMLYGKSKQPTLEDNGSIFEQALAGTLQNQQPKGEQIEPYTKKLIGAGEAAVSSVYNPLLQAFSQAKGVIESLPQIATGHAPEIGQAKAEEFYQKHAYQPKTEEGKQYLQALSEIPEKITGSSMPISPLPELAGIGLGKNATQQIEKTFAQTKGEIPIVPSAGRNVGAAESTIQNQVKTALNEAPDYLKQSLKDVPIEKLATEENLKAIENHNKFAKFGLVPTEGQALENTSLMSDEFNARKKDPNIQARLEERDPKLIQAFNDIKDKVSADVFENDPARLASMPLDKVKSIYQQKEQNVSNLWKQANLASGTAQAPIDVGALRENIINGLKEKQRTRYVPAGLQADLDETLGKGFMTPEEYENFRSDTATISRTSPDPFARQAAAIIREKLEQVPIKDEFAQYKPLYDQARKATTDLHSFEKSPVVKAAISDTRTPDEIAAGMPHPAAKNFVAQHYSAKTPQVEIERMLDLIGRNSPEHQALNKLKINEFKLNSGIVNDKGTVSQQALNKQIHEQHQTNLASMFGQETAKDLRDLADVANLTEPRKGVHSVNTSNSEILREQNAREAAKEAAGNVAAGVAESAVNAKVPFAGTIIRKTIGGMKAGKEAKELARLAQEESERRLSPKAGIKLKDIGK